MLRIRIRTTTFSPAQGQDLDSRTSEIVHAALVGAAFVSFVGTRRVAVLVTPGFTVIVEEDEVATDVRDDGNVLLPYDAPESARSHVHLDFTDY